MRHADFMPFFLNPHNLNLQLKLFLVIIQQLTTFFLSFISSWTFVAVVNRIQQIFELITSKYVVLEYFPTEKKSTSFSLINLKNRNHFFDGLISQQLSTLFKN